MNELRTSVIKALTAVIITTSICFIFSQDLINYMATPIGGRESMVSREVTENMDIFMRVSLLGDVVPAIPFIIYQAMRLLMPGLNKKEKTWLVLGIPMV